MAESKHASRSVTQVMKDRIPGDEARLNQVNVYGIVDLSMPRVKEYIQQLQKTRNFRVFRDNERQEAECQVMKGEAVWTFRGKWYKQKFQRHSGINDPMVRQRLPLQANGAYWSNWSGLPAVQLPKEDFDYAFAGIVIDTKSTDDTITGFALTVDGTAAVTNTSNVAIDNGAKIRWCQPQEGKHYNLDKNGIPVPLYKFTQANQFEARDRTDWHMPSGVEVVTELDELFGNKTAHAIVRRGALPGDQMWVQLLPHATQNDRPTRSLALTDDTLRELLSGGPDNLLQQIVTVSIDKKIEQAIGTWKPALITEKQRDIKHLSDYAKKLEADLKTKGAVIARPVDVALAMVD